MLARVSLLTLVFCAIAGCGGAVKAPKSADGGKVSLFIQSDRGIRDTMTDEEKAELNELGEWMEKEMVRIFTEGGYRVSMIKDFNAFTHGKNEYLMTFAIEKYEPARLTPEVERGLGEGQVSIDTYVELFYDSDQPLLKRKEGFSSARGWKYCAGVINRALLPDVSDRINELQ